MIPGLGDFVAGSPTHVVSTDTVVLSDSEAYGWFGSPTSPNTFVIVVNAGVTLSSSGVGDVIHLQAFASLAPGSHVVILNYGTIEARSSPFQGFGAIMLFGQETTIINNGTIRVEDGVGSDDGAACVVGLGTFGTSPSILTVSGNTNPPEFVGVIEAFVEI